MLKLPFAKVMGSAPGPLEMIIMQSIIELLNKIKRSGRLIIYLIVGHAIIIIIFIIILSC